MKKTTALLFIVMLAASCLPAVIANSVPATQSGARQNVSFVARRDYAIRDFALGIGVNTVAAGDFNLDGFADLAAAGESNSRISILLGRGDGTFYAPYEIPPLVNLAGTLLVADFNRDGLPDLALSAESTIAITLGNGDGTFQNPFRVTPPGTAGSRLRIVSGDFNGDGRRDIASVFYNFNGTLTVYLGNGDGTLQAGRDITGLDFPYSVTTGDFDRDGALDLAVAGHSPPVHLLRGPVGTGPLSPTGRSRCAGSRVLSPAAI